MIPQMNVEMFQDTPLEKEYRKFAANPNGFPELAKKLIRSRRSPWRGRQR